MPHLEVIRRAGVVLVLVAGGLFIVAPLLMPEGYSWIRNSISESGAQQVTGAWATRLGFLCFGLGAMLISITRTPQWGAVASWFMAIFAFLMLTVAAFSTRSWQPEASYDAWESILHSISASAMGFAYGIGTFLIALTGSSQSLCLRVFGFVATASSIVCPVLAAMDPSLGGVYQRIMFAIAIAWLVWQGASRVKKVEASAA